jgi:pyruvate dehydrogenase E2 component (dihydrolipoyllysine-residue acetyltransferase)
MTEQIKLPHLGENIESGDVLSIFVQEGDEVSKDQDLLEIETDKATMPVPSPQAGKITKILVSEGQTVAIGAPIMEIEAAKAGQKPTDEKPPKSAGKAAEKVAEEEAAEEAPAEESPKSAKPAAKRTQPKAPLEPAEEPREEPETKTTKKPAPAPKMAAVADLEDVPGDGHAAAAAGPAVRRLARQLGVDLRRVRPSGEHGRITEDDVQSFVRETNEQVAATVPRGVTPPGKPDADEFGAIRIERMSRLRQTIARNMLASYTTIPQLTNFDDVDVTELEDMRDQSKRDYTDRGIKLTAMPFLIKAVASSLKRHPVVNASVDMNENQVIYKEYVHIGVAVDTDRGLLVPVLRDADRKSISQIASELERLATVAREGELSLEEMRGGTFTISNLGAVGGTYSTPIINPPQVAILLIGRNRTMPQFVEGRVEPRLIMPLSLTYDHRVVDGAAAARFLNEVKGFLAAPGRLLLAP